MTEEKDKDLEAILDYNGNEKKETKHSSKNNKKNLIIIAISLIAVAIIAFTFIPNKRNAPSVPAEVIIQEQEQEQVPVSDEELKRRQMNYIDNNILFYHFYYQNNSIYSDLCEKNGYPINNFISILNDKFKVQINEVARMFEILKETTPTLRQDLDRDIDERMRARVENEFNSIRKNLIINLIAANNNTTPENVEWNDSYLESFPISEACRYIDENADDILSATYSMIIPLYKN